MKAESPDPDLVTAIAESGRYDLTGEFDDLDAAWKRWSLLGQESQRPDIHPTGQFDAWVESCVVNVLYSGYVPEVAAITQSNLATALLAVTEPDRTMVIRILLGCLHLGRYRRSGNLAELERGIEMFQACAFAAAHGGQLPLLRVAALNNLTSALALRHIRNGSIEDLRSALETADECVVVLGSCSPTRAVHPFLPSVPGPALLMVGHKLSVLAGVDSGREQDQFRHQLMESVVITNLAIVRRMWAERRGDACDLGDLLNQLRQLSTRIEQRRVGQAPAVRLAALFEQGNLLRTLDALTGRPGLLEESIKRFDLANTGTFAWIAGWGRRVCSLADCLLRKHSTTGEVADLDRAELILKVALGHIEPATPERIAPLSWLARVHRRRYDVEGAGDDALRAIDAYRAVVAAGLDNSPDDALLAAQEWAGWAVERHAWRESGEPFAAARAATQMLYQRQVTRRSKELRIRDAEGLASASAYASVRYGDLRQAVSALEASRARLLGEALDRRSAEVEQLALIRPDLRSRFVAAADRLDQWAARQLDVPT